MDPQTATAEFLESIGLEPERFDAWRKMYTHCDGATGTCEAWSEVLRRYMHDHLMYLRTGPEPSDDPDTDMEAAIWQLQTCGGLTRAASQDILRRLEDDFGSFALESLMPSQYAISYVEHQLHQVIAALSPARPKSE